MIPVPDYKTFFRLTSLLLLLAALPAAAQTNLQTFGQNRIQYKNFDWQYYSTQNFDVYFYDGGDKIAIHAAEYAEKELKRITNLIGYFPYSKTTIIIFNSVGDQRQSNIGLNDDRYQTGGETLFLKNKVEIAFTGTQVAFKKDLSFRLSELLLNDMMYGGSLKEVLQSTYLLQLPEWFVQGASAYLAEGWSVDMDNYMRDMIVKTEGKKPDQVFSRNQRLAGQALWNYIAERYGYTAIQNILNLTRITRDIEIGIASSLNVPYRRFMRDWHTHYLQMNTNPDLEFTVPDKENQVVGRNRRDLIYSEPVLSPDGTRLAYVVNDIGRYKIKVRNIKSGNIKTVRKSGYKTPDQRVEYKVPALAWRNNTVLAATEQKKGRVIVQQINANHGPNIITAAIEGITGKGNYIDLKQFSHVQDISYSEDGKSAVISAVKDGQSDIYLLSGGRPQQLTNDIFDDIQPVFLKGTNTIVFSSNRYIDTTGTDKGTFIKVVENYDIFLLDPANSLAAPQQITSSISNELQPKAGADANELLYLSEESGIRRLYKHNLSTGEKIPVTAFLPNIKSYSYHPEKATLSFVAADRNHDFVYVYPNFALTEQMPGFKTARQEILEDRSKAEQARESNRRLIDPNAETGKEKGIDIQNYQFNNEPKKKKNKATPPPATTPGALVITGPIKYKPQFSINNVVSSIYRDPLMGFGLIGEVGMSDLFENHRIRGGFFAQTDLRTSSFLAEYSNLQKRYDLRFTYQKQSIYANFDAAYIRFGKHEITPSVSYPLTQSFSVRFMPKFASTRFTFINNFNFPDIVNNFVGNNVEVVFDNSIVTGINMNQGTRMKAGLLNMASINDKTESFNKLYVDLRHYQPVYKEITWASRASYGQFFGNDPKQFLLGGMDNWLFAQEDAENAVNINTAADLFYLQYATNLRGFNYNARNGNKYLLFNTELRIPIVQYLSSQPVNSGFFRNLQLSGFVDAGSAYTGSNPFSRNNSFNRQVIQRGAFEAIVINYRNPFLVGYGFGARTTLLGIYGKFDVAWGEEDFQQSEAKYYITLGYDF